MAYLIEGERHSVVYCANVRTGSTATAATLLNMGAKYDGQHHDPPSWIPNNALVVQTVRHHCDVLVSYWFKKANGMPFDKFVQKVLDGEHIYLKPDYFYSNFETNYILRYESLQLEFDVLCISAGLPETKLIRKASKRPKNMKWNHLFTPQLFDKVYKRYHEEMEEFGYGRN